MLESLETETIVAIAATAVAAIALAVSIGSFRLASKSYRLTPKRELLKTLVGTRYVLAEAMADRRKDELGNRFFTALNTVSVVFGNDEKVLDALREYRTKKSRPEDLAVVLQAMAEAADVEDNYHFEDEQLMEPFVPNAGTGSSSGGEQPH